MSRCLECDCPLVRDYKCPHDCNWCKDYDPDDDDKNEEQEND